MTQKQLVRKIRKVLTGPGKLNRAKKESLRAYGVILLIVAVSALSFAYSAADGGGHGDGKNTGLEHTFYQKVHMMNEHQAELGLSEEQIQKLMTMKTDLKKDLIQAQAKIDVVALDIKSGLYGRQVDVDGINDLIDKKYEIKRDKAKRVVRAYADLKKMLSDKQYSEMKQLKRGSKS